MMGGKEDEMDEQAIQDKLIVGYDWMKLTTDDDKRNDFYNDKWMPLLALYTSVCGGGFSEQDAVRRLLTMEKPLPEPSPHIEELREQLLLGGIADVERTPYRKVE
jgi:hypothetical protein